MLEYFVVSVCVIYIIFRIQLMTIEQLVGSFFLLSLCYLGFAITLYIRNK